ncbi:ROK family transcriptional regulator [Bifidobacterium sp. ESL0732]|uniref:ROK family transcriptional regulator n=1 Tax=Bifidobacterium sp. ESL0732 TaxID=2983222 RepID=UPI0023F79EBD|nr:ROK family transcriptional regulator [Bifidobacterium sp. ESL0732]WEV63575.1 ROK family transcriptional regulator [Bifidobacterium sp. ESL0732]
MVDRKLDQSDKSGHIPSGRSDGFLSGALPSDVRVRNRTAILRALYSGERLSRAELAKVTGISKVSTSDVVSDLMSDGYLRELGYKSSARRGKPALMLEFDPTAKAVIGVDLSESHEIKGVVSDLKGTILHRESLSLADGQWLGINQVVTLCEALMADNDLPLLGLGVATPGFVDSNGVVIEAPLLGWKDVDIVGKLESRLGCYVYASNDADCGVFAERSFAAGPPSMMFVQIAKGVGAGLLVSDAVVRGIGNTAGEIGHVVVDPDGPECVCGKRGCLETIIAAPVLDRQITAWPERREEVIGHAGEVLGRALAMVVAMTDITDVTVAGPENLVDAHFCLAAQNQVNRLVHSRFIDEIVVHGPHLKEDTSVLGAVANVLRSKLNLL